MTEETPDILISRELERIAKMVDQELRVAAGSRYPFVLIVAQKDDNDEASLIHNCSEKDAAEIVKSLAAQMEASTLINLPLHEKERGTH